MSIIKLNNNGVKNATAFGSITGLGGMTFIKKLTASGSSTLSFVDGSSGVTLDNSYKEYLFTFKNIHAGTHAADFTFNGSTDSGSNYNVAKTTTTWYSYHNEGDSATGVGYDTGHDIAQGTGYCQIGGDAMGTDNDQGCSGSMFLFNPSSQTFAKHFLVTMNTLTEADYNVNEFTGGYLNSSSAVDAISFKMSTGTFDGDICLYGIA